MTWLIALLLSLRPTTHEAARLSVWDPYDLDIVTAGDNVQAARFAGLVYGVDPYLLLGIAHHESRFRPGTITVEPPAPGTRAHRVSCGVMTPTPQPRCSPDELTLEGGYMAGAKHYRAWLDHYGGSEWAALTAYVGGSGLVNVCRRGRWVVRGRNICDVVGEFRWRARAIRHAIAGP